MFLRRIMRETDSCANI